MNHTPEQRADDADIARAMGWTKSDTYKWDDRIWFSPNLGRFKYPPRFHESHEARAALLEWLAADDAQWQRFEWVFYGDHLPCFDGMDTGEMVRAAFLATPAQVAEAAWQVIQEEKK